MSESDEHPVAPDGVAELTEPAFAELVNRHRRELHVHCYRMLGSFEEAEDHVQDVFLRAWRARATYAGRAGVRTWLYRIATNACVDTLRRDTRRAGALAGQAPGSVASMPWVQPFPDSTPVEPADPAEDPETAAIRRETTSLAFLVTIQLLPPRQRAVLILRDLLDWPATRTAEVLDTTVASVNSALQRARTTLRDQIPGHQPDLTPAAPPSPAEQQLLRQYIDAHEQADPEALIAILRADVRLTISPEVGVWTGRDTVAAALRAGMNSLGRWRLLPITVNGGLGAAGYLRRPGQSDFEPFVLAVLDFRDGRLQGMTAFEQPGLFPAFGLPAKL
ncbi:MAG TPA: RNA polymerase subunit sigma-70 [Pseudonocardiaceae bacterium]|nr:RNA polymerase subunit sigma-70 [Pseudonocardiaceae bacterium]